MYLIHAYALYPHLIRNGSFRLRGTGWITLHTLLWWSMFSESENIRLVSLSMVIFICRHIQQFIVVNSAHVSVCTIVCRHKRTWFKKKNVKCVTNMLEFARTPQFYYCRYIRILGIVFCVCFCSLNLGALYLIKNVCQNILRQLYTVWPIGYLVCWRVYICMHTFSFIR